MFTPSQFVGLGAAPENWSPSSGVKMNRVLLWSIPAALRLAKKRSEGGVKVAKLLYIRSFAGAEGAFRAKGGPFVVVVGIRDVREDHGNPFLRHGLNHRQRLSRLRIEV